MKRSYLTLPIVFLLQGSPAAFGKADSLELKDVVRKISTLREALKTSAGSTQVCDTPESDVCSFRGYCDKMAGKAQDFYLYQDDQGRKIPNHQLISAMNLAELCGKQSFSQAPVKDPFVYPEQLTDAEKAGGAAELKKNRELYNKELARTREIFSDVQKRLVKLLESRRNATNSAEIDVMIKRVSTVKFTPVRLDRGLVGLSAGGCESPNAFYKAHTHEITVCPQMLNMPEASLYHTLAHELGHSIDPCISAFSYSRDEKGSIKLNEPEFLGGFPNKKQNDFLKSLVPEKNPLGSVVSCLQSPSSVGAKVPSKAELLAAVDAEEADTRKKGADSDQGQVSEVALLWVNDKRDKIRENYDQYKNCAVISGVGYLSEAWSDWVAGEVVMGKIHEIPDSHNAREYAFASQANFLSQDCNNIGESAFNRAKGAVGGNCQFLNNAEKEFKNSETLHSTSHPSPSKRVNRIFMAKPEIQKALRCQGNPEDNGTACN